MTEVFAACVRPKRYWVWLAIPVLVLMSSQTLPSVAHPDTLYDKADLEALEKAFIEVARDVMPSIVAIRTYNVVNPQGKGRAAVRIPLSQGSGFVLSEDGMIVTNYHVLEDADVVSVIFQDGVSRDTVLIGADPRSDLAIIQADVEGLIPARLGRAEDIRVNQWIFAAGNPFGLGNETGIPSITLGVVSALERDLTARLVGNSPVEYYGNLIETSAPINPGNSGGALINLDGEVVGVVTAIETTSGVGEGRGFAIPVDKNMKRILDILKSGKEVHYGFLGVTVMDLDRPTSRRVANSFVPRGAKIESISVPQGPAYRAGLRAEDVVIEFDGTKVKNRDHLVRLVGFTPVGTEARVTYLRKGVKRKTIVSIGDRDKLLRSVGGGR